MVNGDREEFATLLKAWSATIVDNDAEVSMRSSSRNGQVVGESGIISRQRYLGTQRS